MSTREAGLPGRRGTRLFLAGTFVAQVCALARYTVLARLLGPEQLGLAVTVILTSQFFESISDSGSDRLLIQDRDGDKPRLQRLVQLLAIARGVAIALALVVCARPIAHFYHQDILSVGIVGLALAPLITGFMHFDLRRMQRHNDFSREGLVMLVSESVTLIVTTIAAIITRDFTAGVYGLIARAIAMVVMSRIVAERRYDAGYSPEYARRLARFATPLMANGLLLFFAMQGDRLLIGNQLGVSALGHYSAILLLIFYPSAMVGRYVQSMHLPIVAAARDVPAARFRAADALGGETVLAGLAMLAGFAVIAPIAVPLLYGPAFRQPATVIALIGAIQVCRFIRVWPTAAAMAMGRSGVVLVNNLLRIIAFPSALFGLAWLGGLSGLTIGFAVGEVVAMAASVCLSDRAIGLSAFANMGRMIAITACGAAVIGAAAAVDAGRGNVAFAAIVATTALLAIVVWRERETVVRLAAVPLRLRARLLRSAR